MPAYCDECVFCLCASMTKTCTFELDISAQQNHWAPVSHLVTSYLVSSYLVSSLLFSSLLLSSLFFPSHFISSHLNSSLLFSSPVFSSLPLPAQVYIILSSSSPLCAAPLSWEGGREEPGELAGVTEGHCSFTHTKVALIPELAKGALLGSFSLTCRAVSQDSKENEDKIVVVFFSLSFFFLLIFLLFLLLPLTGASSTTENDAKESCLPKRLHS